MIEIDNKKIHDLIVDKDALVDAGRAVSKKLDELEKQITDFEKKERAITSKVRVVDLEKKGNEINDTCAKMFEELNKILGEIEQKRLEAIPKEMKDAHYALLAEREKLERERNKLALKVQKVKDKVVPLIQKHVKPLLEKYDDIETAKTKDGKVIINTFNYLEDFKSKFNR